MYCIAKAVTFGFIAFAFVLAIYGAGAASLQLLAPLETGITGSADLLAAGA